MLTYDPSVIPFSLPGSFLTIAAYGGQQRLVYQTCSSRAVTSKEVPYVASHFFELALIQNGQEVSYHWEVQPHRLDLEAADGSGATFVFADVNTIAFETHGVNLRLVPCKTFATQFSPFHGQVGMVDWRAKGIHYLRAAQDCGLHITSVPTPAGMEGFGHDQPYQVDFLGSCGALRFSENEHLWNEDLPDMQQLLTTRQLEYDSWLAKMPAVPTRYQEAAEPAWFLLWNCQVSASGALTRPAIYMSKFWMNHIWAWDNCFNALAVAQADPEMAWNQLLLFFDHQDSQGMVPDMIGDLEAIYCFNKPPIHGWTVRKLVAQLGVEICRPYIADLYEPLVRLTEWWYRLRDTDQDGMCQYHHGNDSGWDNATLFDQGYPTEGSDLAAHLVLQQEGLALMAEILGKPGEAERWRQGARQQLDDLLKKGVKDQHFYSPLDGHTSAPVSQSLLNYIPVELGRYLPEGMRQALVSDLQPHGPFLTDYGLATESPRSPKYEADGYWRGPIWAPSTYLIFDGLVDAGETVLAKMIAERFCDMCVKNPGFWENYDALTGKGLRCPGYTWTASVFLLMAEWLDQMGK